MNQIFKRLFFFSDEYYLYFRTIVVQNPFEDSVRHVEDVYKTKYLLTFEINFFFFCLI